MKLFSKSIIPETNLYFDNKYTQWYYDIINNARNRVLDKSIYIERHHIIPKCMNGSDDKTNIVKLTAREHFLCHWLLTKMVSKNNYNRMLNAVWRMVCIEQYGRRYKINSRIYQKLREQFSLLMSNRIVSEITKDKIRTARVNQIISNETKIKMSESAKGRISHRKGKKLSKSHIENVRKSIIGRKYWNNGIKNKVSKICPGPEWKLGCMTTWTEERRIKTKESQKGKNWYNNGLEELCRKESPGINWIRGRLSI